MMMADMKIMKKKNIKKRTIIEQEEIRNMHCEETENVL